MIAKKTREPAPQIDVFIMQRLPDAKKMQEATNELDDEKKRRLKDKRAKLKEERSKKRREMMKYVGIFEK